MKRININNQRKAKGFLFFSLAFLTGCINKPVIEREFNREGEPLIITIKAYRTLGFEKVVKNPQPGLNGEATYSPNDNKCDIIVKSFGPNLLDGVFTQSIGHEVMHCLYGDYHGEKTKPYTVTVPPVVKIEED